MRRLLPPILCAALLVSCAAVALADTKRGTCGPDHIRGTEGPDRLVGGDSEARRHVRRCERIVRR